MKVCLWTFEIPSRAQIFPRLSLFLDNLGSSEERRINDRRLSKCREERRREEQAMLLAESVSD
jgi:hypothetical protein